MNTTLKATLALGAAALSLMTLAGGAGAQTTTGDPALTTVYSTLANGRVPGFAGGSVPIGFDPSGKVSPFSMTQATAASVYDAFVFDSSAAGAFTTLAAGATAQLQVFATNNSTTEAPTFNVYASLYAYDPNAAAGTVPATGTNLFGSEQKITLGTIGAGYFSSDFTLAAPLVAGNTYVLGLTTLNTDSQDFANIAVSPFSATGLSAANQQLSKNKYITTVGDQGNPVGSPFQQILASNNVIAFRLNAAPASAPVPEASSVVSMGLMLGLGGALVAFKRRRTIAK